MVNEARTILTPRLLVTKMPSAWADTSTSLHASTCFNLTQTLPRYRTCGSIETIHRKRFLRAQDLPYRPHASTASLL